MRIFVLRTSHEDYRESLEIPADKIARVRFRFRDGEETPYAVNIVSPDSEAWNLGKHHVEEFYRQWIDYREEVNNHG